MGARPLASRRRISLPAPSGLCAAFHGDGQLACPARVEDGSVEDYLLLAPGIPTGSRDTGPLAQRYTADRRLESFSPWSENDDPHETDLQFDAWVRQQIHEIRRGHENRGDAAMTTYRHTQPGTLIRLMIGGGVILCVALSASTEGHPIALAVGAALLICLVLFHSLTVEVDPHAVRLWFGPGIIKRTFQVDSITGATAVRNRWYHGWGVRRYPGGWLYNVSGLDAVEITLSDGRKYRIGTNEPQKLQAAIQAALSRQDSSSRTL